MTPRYLLDTNICIYLMKRQPPSVAQRFAQCYVGEVVMSSITLAELEFGVLASGEHKNRNAKALRQLLQDIVALPFDAAAAKSYASIRLSSAKRSDALDKLIAAHALALKVTLVTNNEADFIRYPKLNVENWVAAYQPQH